MTDQDSAAKHLESLLAGIRAKRGFLLPHHGLMAITSPKLLEAYDATYTVLALEDRVLDHHDREFVWLAILIATDEAIATHHIPKFRDAGGTNDEIDCILAITALAGGFGAYRFVEEHWRDHLPGLDPRESYLTALRRQAGDIPVRLVHMACAAVHTCHAAFDALAWQIEAAYADGIDETELAEALSLAMFPGSIPHFVEAARVWRELIVAQRVPASPRFRAWASLSGQGGYDEVVAAKSKPDDAG